MCHVIRPWSSDSLAENGMVERPWWETATHAMVTRKWRENGGIGEGDMPFLVIFLVTCLYPPNSKSAMNSPVD